MLSFRAIRGNIRRGAARKNWFHMGCCWRINWLCHRTSAWTFSFTAHLPLFISLMLFQLFTSAHMLMTYKKKWRDFLISEHVFSPEGWNPIEGMGASTPLLPLLLLTPYFSPSLSEKCEKESRHAGIYCKHFLSLMYPCYQCDFCVYPELTSISVVTKHSRFNKASPEIQQYETEHVIFVFLCDLLHWTYFPPVLPILLPMIGYHL